MLAKVRAAALARLPFKAVLPSVLSAALAVLFFLSPGAVLLGAMLPAPAQAEELLVTGRALLRGRLQTSDETGKAGGQGSASADLPLARQMAYRDALLQAAMQRQVSISAASFNQSGHSSETALLGTAVTIGRGEIVEERREMQDGNEYLQLTVRVIDPDPVGRGTGLAACDAVPPLRKILVTGFALRHPEQVSGQELGGYSQRIPVELARSLSRSRRVLAEAAANGFIYTRAEAAPQLLPAASDGLFEAMALSRRHRSPYVLAGVVEEFGVQAAANWLEPATREVVISAYLHDGMSGAVLAHRSFGRQISGEVRLPRKLVFGSEAFYNTDLGRGLGELFAEIGQWAAGTVACMPIAARVVKIEAQRVYIDLGAESRISQGDTLSVFRVARSGKVLSLGGELLGIERSAAATLHIRDVYPLFAIGRFEGSMPADIQVGDELFAF